jgi:hypothetical protein
VEYPDRGIEVIIIIFSYFGNVSENDQINFNLKYFMNLKYPEINAALSELT